MLFSVLLISSSMAKACAWWPEGDQIRFCIFSADLAEGDDMSELFYSPHFFNNWKVDEYVGPTENLQEWYAYFDGKFSLKTLDEAIYRYQPTRWSYWSTEERAIDLSDNKLLKHFKKGGHQEAAEYLYLAIDIEKELRSDPWSEKESDEAQLNAYIAKAEKKLKSVKDDYIQLRYAYQLIVMNFYKGDGRSVEHYYNTYVKNSKQTSVIKSWAQYYYAEMIWDKDQRLYQLSRVFDESKAKCRKIWMDYPSDRKSVSGALKLCKNDREKATILSILAFKNPGRAMDQFKEITDLHVNDELVDILLIREINKMEDWYFSDRYLGYGMSIDTYWSENPMFDFIKERNFESDKHYLKSFCQLTIDILKKKNVENQGLWYTSVAYMAYMLDDQKTCDQYLELAHQAARKNEVKAQIATIELLQLVKYENEWDEEFQQQLMKGIQQLEENKDYILNYNRFYAQIMLAISRKYLEEENYTLAALFESKVKTHDFSERFDGWVWSFDESGYQAFNLLNETATSEDMEEFFAWMNKKDKSRLEKWLFEDVEPYQWRLMDLWGTSYLREDQLEKALAIYEQIPDSVWQVTNDKYHYYYRQELDNDPFETNIYGRSYGNPTGNTYTKPEFVREILRLQRLLKGPGEDKAHYALLLGNAYYNMGYHGNSYYYTEYSWSSYEADDYKRDQSSYYSSDKALKYYQMAEDMAPNQKYAAFCHRLQLKCKRDSYYNLEYWKDKADRDWAEFAQKYPDHAPRLKNCDYLLYYTDAWKEE